MELVDTEGIHLEPSALAGMIGPIKLAKEGKLSKATHMIWATGGNMVPEDMLKQYYQKGLDLTRG